MLTMINSSGRHRATRGTLVGVLALAAAAGIAACHSSSPTTTATTSAGEVASSNPASSVISSLTGAVPGLSSSQATVGAGSLLGLAQGKMPADQFTQVANAVPGTSSLISAAQKAGLPGASQLTSLNSIMPLMSKVGISPSTLGQLTPALGSIIGAKGGPDLASSFLSAVK